MLIGNQNHYLKNAGKLLSGGAAAGLTAGHCQANYIIPGSFRSAAWQDGASAGLPLRGIPTGYSQRSFFLPIGAGNISAPETGTFGFTTTATILAGKALISDPTNQDIGIATNTPAMLPTDTTSPLRNATTTFGFTADATGALTVTVAAGDAPATFGIATNVPLLTASLGGDGTATFGFSIADATIFASGDAVATTTFGFTTAWTAYATGSMSGTTADSGVTIDNIVLALEAAILPVDIVKVNSYTVTGNGQSGTEWGP